MPYIIMVVSVIFVGLVIGYLGNGIHYLWGAPVCVVLALGFLAVMVRKISVPVRNAAALANDLAEGEGDLTIRLQANDRDELGELGTRLNVFIDRLSKIISEIRSGVKDTRKNSDQVCETMNNALTSVSEITAVIDEVKQTILGQAEIVLSISSTVEEMNGITKEQDDKINNQSRNVSKSSSAIEEMMANINSIADNLRKSSLEFGTLNTEAQSGRVAVEELKKTVLALNEQSDSVFEANQIIRNIASQTNLLAMNAAIEAAHAGETGKGFAVVSDEIRKLAEVSNAQSRIISENLKNLKDSIDLAVRNTDNTGTTFDVIFSSVDTVTRIEEEIKNSVEEQSEGSAQILEALASIRQSTDAVHSGSGTMLTGSNAILGEMSKLRSITEGVRDSAVDIARKAKDVEQMVSGSTKSVDETLESISCVESQVAIFKIN
ncbi:methyl-accepting chemotaxis protein [Breznakiella homolactica]|uniref:Methyl-accepting chemotaxis protein n=1 Tax=Breznakiella homolactica TaxID=2798577 RepID=A0A7T7XMH3_9SPIR|nr:HAMP domain-containing methyl-accepting chemotaxis protein [Breznakiella homolactica]QQO08993.1 methyl-accepting chemotaxis protein [Breznakiella homolactica]